MGRSIRRQVRTSFSVGRPSRLMNPPGKAAGGVGVFTVIHREREEIGAHLGLRRGTRGHQDHGFPRADDDGAVGLLGHFSGLDGDDPATAEIHFNGMVHFIEILLI